MNSICDQANNFQILNSDGINIVGSLVDEGDDLFSLFVAVKFFIKRRIGLMCLISSAESQRKENIVSVGRCWLVLFLLIK